MTTQQNSETGEGILWGYTDAQPDHGSWHVKDVDELKVGETLLWCHFELGKHLVTIESLDVEMMGQRGFSYRVVGSDGPRFCEYYWALGLEPIEGRWLLNNWFEREPEVGEAE